MILYCCTFVYNVHITNYQTVKHIAVYLVTLPRPSDGQKSLVLVTCTV